MKRKIILIGLLFLVMFVLPVSSEFPLGNSIEVEYLVLNLSDYEAHDPILITCDEDFVTQGWPGNGTTGNPYIIESLVIVGINVASIMIHDTTVYFIVRDCHLYGGSYGIEAWRISNGLMENNMIHDFWAYGIFLGGSFDNIIRDNFIYHDLGSVAPAIRIAESGNNTIQNNQCRVKYGNAIDIFHSYNCSIVGNNCSYNEHGTGIYLDTADNATILDNICDSSVNGIVVASAVDVVQNYRIINNTCVDNRQTGLYINAGPDMRVRYSIIINNTLYRNEQNVRDNGYANSWDDGIKFGNIYDDYDGVGGIYEIEGSAGSIDHYPRGPIILDWYSGGWLNETTYQKSALFGVDCQYYVYTPSIIHTDLTSTFTGEKGDISAGESSIIIHVAERFWGASIYFNTTYESIESLWMPVLKLGFSGGPVTETDKTIEFSLRFDSRTNWVFGIDGVVCESGIVNDSRWSQEYLHFIFDKDLTIGEHSYWFNISQGLYWENQYLPSGDYVNVPPEIDEISDIEYELGTLGHTITWSSFDKYPDSYEVYRNETLIEFGEWNGFSINVNIDGLELGLYNYTLFVNNTLGFFAVSSINVFVVDTTLPILNSPNDIECEYGTIGGNIIWSVFDYSLCIYEVFRNGTQIESGDWNGLDIVIFINGFDLGTYNYTLVVNDISGNTATDTVLVMVADTISPQLNSPEDIEYEFGMSGNNITWSIFDLNPYIYELHVNGDLDETGLWEELSIVIDIDGLLVGQYNYTLLVSDTSGNVDIDTVIVTVTETTTSTTTTTVTTDTTTTEPITDEEFELIVFLAILGMSIAIIIIVILYMIKKKQ